MFIFCAVLQTVIQMTGLGDFKDLLYASFVNRYPFTFVPLILCQGFLRWVSACLLLFTHLDYALNQAFLFCMLRVGLPAFLVAIDRPTNSLVIAVRGTRSPHDIVTDGIAGRQLA